MSISYYRSSQLTNLSHLIADLSVITINPVLCNTTGSTAIFKKTAGVTKYNYSKTKNMIVQTTKYNFSITKCLIQFYFS